MRRRSNGNRIKPERDSALLPAGLRQTLASMRLITQVGIEALAGWDRKTCRSLPYMSAHSRAARPLGGGDMTTWEYKGVDANGRKHGDPAWGS